MYIAFAWLMVELTFGMLPPENAGILVAFKFCRAMFVALIMQDVDKVLFLMYVQVMMHLNLSVSFTWFVLV